MPDAHTAAGSLRVDAAAAAPARDHVTRFLERFDGMLGVLDNVREAGLYPLYPALERVDGGRAWVDGRRHIVFLSNNYLGLADDPRVHAAAREAIEEFGTGRGASPVAGGHTWLHRRLEERLADFVGQQSAVLFSTGYQANLGTIAALMGRGDLVVSDLCNHASIIDGIRLSGAELQFFQHNHPRHLEAVLKRAAAGRRTLVVVEGIYSLDGDVGCLPDIAAVAHAHGAVLMVDEAHSLGVLGRTGRGAIEEFDVFDDVDIVMGTFSKSLGTVGGFVAGSRRMIEVVRHTARALIFSAALPPPIVAATTAALQLICDEPERRERLWRQTRRLLDGLRALGFDTLRSSTPVIPVLVGSSYGVGCFVAGMREQGVLVCPVSPPMVPERNSRLRAHVTANHRDEDIDEALAAFERVGVTMGLLGPDGTTREGRDHDGIK